MAMGRAAFTIYPAGMAISVMLFLPDREPDFDLVDNLSASLECFVAMRRRDAHPHRAFTNFQLSCAMYTMSVQKREVLPGLFDNGFAF